MQFHLISLKPSSVLIIIIIFNIKTHKTGTKAETNHQKCETDDATIDHLFQAAL